ncbi:hypothetical protein M2272_003395 [Mycobacterium frederiksbergense]|uniref:PASTA domain-containing protein n=1 Tax=Mycolicibacterium frederiksbergense TaxID=117567 RepID=A0ABT6L3E5_9MYCO|nr:hypothetical protein [Mycolicibacterium frederiksbergense]MDH6196742.1 hypothetical protein [Mycolicibacterium frederiksbergense]
MRRLVAAALVFGASAVPVGMVATGVAAADDYAGQKYSVVQSELSGAGMKAVVATRSGGSGSDDNCVVTSSEKAPWKKGSNFAAVTDTVLLNLDCNAGVASATTPGNSAASPQGRQAIQQADQAAAQAQAEAANHKAKH